ncbi:hypothetical protein [Pseudoteredinibacter isoporae]|uniref:hypothetical protein n=1 Tax=Pseudoteredinibacter isoporae TaxID=570281 RepID=UPI0031087AB4
MAYREQVLWVDGLIMLGLIGYTVKQLLLAGDAALFNVEQAYDVVASVLFMAVVAYVLCHIAIAVVSNKETEDARDEREQQAVQLGAYWSSTISQTTIVLALVQFGLTVQFGGAREELSLAHPLLLLLIGLILAELSNTGRQLWYLYRGV